MTITYTTQRGAQVSIDDRGGINILAGGNNHRFIAHARDINADGDIRIEASRTTITVPSELREAVKSLLIEADVALDQRVKQDLADEAFSTAMHRRMYGRGRYSDC